MLAEVTSLALLGALVLASAGIAKLWNQATLSNVTLERSLSRDRALQGDVVTLGMTVTNRKPLPAPSIRIEEDLSEHVVPVGHRSTIDGTSGRRVLHLTGALRPYERITWSSAARVPGARRALGRAGDAALGRPVRVLFKPGRRQAKSASCWSIQRFTPCPELVLPNQQPMGERTVSRETS